MKYNGTVCDYTDDSQCRGILFGIWPTPWRSTTVCRDELSGKERMTVYQVNDFRYVRELNVLTDEEHRLILNDALGELRHNPCTDENTPPIQTWPILFVKFGHMPHWKTLALKAHSLTERYYNRQVKSLDIGAWANLSNETNRYTFHQHKCDCTAVFYLQSDLPEYGTDINNEFIIKSTQNSMIVFDSKKIHSVTDMPPELGKIHNRISISMDIDCCFR